MCSKKCEEMKNVQKLFKSVTRVNYIFLPILLTLTEIHMKRKTVIIWEEDSLPNWQCHNDCPCCGPSWRSHYFPTIRPSCSWRANRTGQFGYPHHIRLTVPRGWVHRPSTRVRNTLLWAGKFWHYIKRIIMELYSNTKTWKKSRESYKLPNKRFLPQKYRRGSVEIYYLK